MGKTKNIIKNIYFYLVVLIGLLMMVIGSVGIIKTGLEAWFFPLASKDMYMDRPTEMYLPKSSIDLQGEAIPTTIELTENERRMFEQWKADYEAWQEISKENLSAQRHQQDMVRNIPLVIIGLILFLSHGYVIRKSKKKDLI